MTAAPKALPAPPTVEELLGRQDLVIARRQVLAAGNSRHWWAWKLQRDWQSLGDGVAVAHRGTPTEQELRWAAVLHAGKTAALTGDASLAFFGVKRLTVVRHDVAIDRDQRTVRVEHAAFTMQPHRVESLELWRAGHPHLPLVHVHAAVLHAAAWAPSDAEAERRLGITVQQHKSNPRIIRTSLAQMPKLPRRALITQVLEEIEHGATSESELDFLRFCRAHGLPEPDAMQVCVRTTTGKRYLDARYRRQKVRVEVDGGHHRWVEQWEADSMRGLELAVATHGSGEQAIRITPGMMRNHAEKTAGLLRALLG